MSDSRFNNFPLVQHSSDNVSNVNENTEGTINTALNFFYPLKKLSTHMPNVPTSTKIKNYIGHYNLPSSEGVMSPRLTSMGLPETLILTSNAPTKETAATRLAKDANLYHPTVLISETLEPVSIDSAYFNEGIVSEGQSTKSQRVSKTLPLVYTVLQVDATGSSNNMVDIKHLLLLSPRTKFLILMILVIKKNARKQPSSFLLFCLMNTVNQISITRGR